MTLSSTFLRPAAAALILLAVGVAAHASGPRKHPAKPGTAQQHTQIQSVNTTLGTVVLREVGPETKDRTVLVNGFTDVTIAGQKSTLTSLKAGMWVDYDLSDENTLASITAVASSPTPAPGHHKK